MLESTRATAASDSAGSDFASSEPDTTVDSQASNNAPAKRLVCVGSNLGLYRPAFYPDQDGSNYQLSPLLKPLARHRENLTVFSGFDHRAGNGHNNWDNYLCGRQVGSVSMDQIAAEQVGSKTRFESFAVVRR